MFERDKAILRYLTSREGIIAISLILTISGIVFIILTGRWELSLFVIAALLPWVEYWSKHRKKQ
jgi:hypothetical protein